MDLTDKDRAHINAVPSAHWCLATKGDGIAVLGLATQGCFASAAWSISDAAFNDISGRKFSWTTGEDENWTDDRSQFLRPSAYQKERYMTPQLLRLIRAKYELPVPVKSLDTVISELNAIDKLPRLVVPPGAGPIIGDQAMWSNMYNKLVNSDVHTDTGRQLVELTYVEHGVHRQQVQVAFTGSIDHLTHAELTQLGEHIRTQVGLLILAKASANNAAIALRPDPTK